MEEIDGESAEQGAAINLRRNSEQSLDDSVEIIEENITTIDLTTAAPTPSSLHLYDADDVFARALPAITTTTTTTTTLMQQQPSAISSVDGSNISSSIDIQQYIHSILTNSAVNSNTSNDIQQYIPTFPNSAAEYTALQIKCEKPSTSTQALKDIGSSSAEASAAAAAAAAILLDNQQPSGSASSGPSTSTSTPVVLECPICLQTCIHPARLPCGHIFCFLCVKGVAYKNRRCAMCRREIPAEFLDHPQLVNGIEDICSTKATEDGYQWFYEGRNGWWQYDDRTSQDLEEAFKKAERSCTILVAGYVYIVDFDAMLQQRQNEPARCRRVKRDLATIPKKGVAGLRIEGNTVTTDTNFAAQINQSRQMRYRGAADLDPESEDDTTSPPFISLRSLMPYSSPYGGLTGYEIELGNPSEFVSTAAATDAALRIASDIIGSTLAHADELSRSTSAANNLSNSLFQRRSNRIPNVDINPSINSNNAAISTATPAQTPETGNTDALALISPPFNRLRSTTAAAAAETQNMFSSLPPTPNPAAITAPASAGLMATAGVRERGSLLGAAEDLLGATQRVIASADQPTIDLFEQTLNDFHALTLGRSLISNYNNDDDDGEGEGDGEVEGDNDVSDIAEHSAQNARSSSEETSAREANDGQPLDNAAETHARNNDAESNAAHTSASNVKSSNHNNS